MFQEINHFYYDRDSREIFCKICIFQNPLSWILIKKADLISFQNLFDNYEVNDEYEFVLMEISNGTFFMYCLL